MIDSKEPQKEGLFNKLINSFDNLLLDEKQQKLKGRLGKKIREKVFTEDIITEINENDISGIMDEEEEMSYIFSSIFPVIIKKDNLIFRLYKHKIELDFSNEMRDRYIYIFNDGRLTSGAFKCYDLCDEEYLNQVRVIIAAIPDLKIGIVKALNCFKENKEMHHREIIKSKKRELVAKENFEKLLTILNDI